MVDLELRNLAHVLGIDIERALSKFEPRLVDGSERIIQVRPGYRGRSHAEELVHRLGRFLDRLNHLMCGRDREPGWAKERPNEAQPRNVGLVPAVLAELSKDKDSGLLGYRLTFGAGGPLLVQYWNSHEQLYHYASDRTAAHRPAWAAFNRRARKAPGAVGIWHETYLVERAESIYSGMPVSGLAAATSSVPVARRGETAAARLGVRRTASVGAISAGQRSGEKWSSGSLAQR
jgi:hypothetical protein